MTMVSTKETNIADAKAAASRAGIREIELAVRGGAITHAAISAAVGGKRKLLHTLFEEYWKWMAGSSQSQNTIKLSQDTLKAWVSLIDGANMILDDVTTISISAYVNRPGDAKAGTRKVQLSHIRSFFAWANYNGLTTRNPAKLVKVDYSKLTKSQKDPTTREPISEEEYGKLIAAADAGTNTFWKAAIRIGRMTGLRISDIACLEWDTFSNLAEVAVWTIKRDKRVILPMPDDLLAVVLGLEREDDTFIFPHQRRTYRDASTRAQLSVQFMRICQKAGVENRCFHGLRHAKLSEEAKENGIESAMALAGHSSTATTRIYVHE